jgi:hypothetical protein
MVVHRQRLHPMTVGPKAPGVGCIRSSGGLHLSLGLNVLRA